MALKKKSASVLVVKEPFGVAYGPGQIRAFRKGQVVRSDDPVVKGRERFFEPAEDKLGIVPVEQATAAPGEVRDVAIPEVEEKRL